MKNELRKYLENIREELENIHNGTTTETNDDGEKVTMWDYFTDVLDYEYTVSSRGNMLGVTVYITLGGPNVWIDTRRQEIAGAWGADRAEIWLPDEIRNEIESIFQEMFDATR